MPTLKLSDTFRSILVVESDPKMVREMEEVIRQNEIQEKNKCQFTFARDARDAMRKLEAQPFDLIVLEIMLPLVSGYHLLAAIHKNLPQTASVPVLVYTRLKNSFDLAKIITLPIRDFFVKSVTKTDAFLQAALNFSGQPVDLEEKLRKIQGEVKSLETDESDTPKILQCPRCHMILTRDSYFCNNCGQRTSATVAKTPAA